MRKIMIASHGEFANGLKNSVMMIVGEMAKDIETFCLYPSQNPIDFKDSLEQEIRQKTDMEYIFLCDIKGGSVHTALSQLCVYPNVKVFSGTNMNLVLDLLLTQHDTLDHTQMESLLRNARDGLTKMTKEDLIIKHDEEF